MRQDSAGLFWEDQDHKNARKREKLKEHNWIELISGYWVEERFLKDEDTDPYDVCMRIEEAYELVRGIKEKREPPFPFWLDANYLPNLEQAQNAVFNEFTDAELVELTTGYVLKREREELIFDIECYTNYFLIAFKHDATGKLIIFELDDNGKVFDTKKLKWVLEHFTIIGFNSTVYDTTLTTLAVHGGNNMTFRVASVEIIEEKMRRYDVLRRHKATKTDKEIDYDHIDLIEVAPLSASLKIYGGRLGTKTMQDLPFPPETILTELQKLIIKWYCINDLDQTIELRNKLATELLLRADMSNEYKVDLRSKSDAQIAEAVIKHEIEAETGSRIYPPKFEEGKAHLFRYQVPSFLEFETPMMNRILTMVANEYYGLNGQGKVDIPESVKSTIITINETKYKIGNGGLHSQEKKTAHIANDIYMLKDWDVESYYPRIILNLMLFPESIGKSFLKVYNGIVERRLGAKASSKDKSLEEQLRKNFNKIQKALKIVINGSFGKFGSLYSTLFSPNLLIQTTVTGQLALLMLIEKCELAGIQVVSANTDGVVMKCPRVKEDLMNNIIKWWEAKTNFKMEGTEYSGLYSRDVNNYVAVKVNAKDIKEDIKVKGAYNDISLQKTPTAHVCVDAIKEYLMNGTKISDTVKACTDIQKFVTVRTVKGGAVMMDEAPSSTEPAKTGQFLGKAVRWYYAEGFENNELIYASNGNRVPKSEGAKPLMVLPNALPTDIKYEWYINEAKKQLSLLGIE